MVETLTVFRSASQHRWLFRLIAMVCAVLGLTSMVGVWMATAEALEERQAATQAADLRLAVVTVASAQPATASEAALADVARAVDALDGDISEAVHSLDESQRNEVAAAVEQIADHGRMLLAGMDSIPGHGLMEHESVEELLRQASVSSNESAASIESVAKWAMASVALFLVILGYALAALRSARHAELAAHDNQVHAAERLAAVLNETPDVKMIFDDNGRITYQSLGMTEMFRGEAVPDNLPELMNLATPEIRDELTAHLLNADATTPPSTYPLAQLIGDPSRTESLELWVSDLRSDPLVEGRLVTGRDVTAEVELKVQLESRALLDALTGLPNRWSLINLMETQSGPVTLLMIDLDGFKQTNDVLGHSAGDQMLRAVARRFVAALGDSDSKLFRLGGDEFAVVIDEIDLIVAQRTARELLSTLTTAVRLDQGFESLRASIGIAMTSPIQTDADEVLKHADIALYAAKAAGGNQFKVFEADMEIAATQRRDLSLALEAADVDTDFRLVFQPLVEAESGRITHLEALLRWTNPSIGFVPPDVFIPAAETSGKIVPLGQFVLAQACGQLAELRAQGLGADVGMTVNISPRQLDQPGFVGRVLALLSHHKLVPGDLTIEVTETVLFREADLGIEQLHELKNSGCHIAVDDFGSGYSNLGRLLEMPLDMIKVDRSLVVTLVEMREQQGGSPEGPCQVMSAIRTIGDAIGAPIVAEGVETEDQWHSMRDSGVQLLQGYLFSKPLEAADVAEVVRNGVPVAPQRVLTS